MTQMEPVVGLLNLCCQLLGKIIHLVFREDLNFDILTTLLKAFGRSDKCFHFGEYDQIYMHTHNNGWCTRIKCVLYFFLKQIEDLKKKIKYIY